MSQNVRGLPEGSIDNGILNDHYTYDQNANVLSIIDGQEGVSTRSMEYDGIDRLKHVVAPSLWATPGTATTRSTTWCRPS
jgi:hypothetical protein